MKKHPLIQELKNVPAKYASVPFWSWNDKLSPEELRRQIRDMKEKGFGGFFMHARGGLMTEYLSDEWFECIEASVDEAKKCGMYAWSYDENGWPSGFAGGKLLKNENYYASFLKYEEKAEFDPTAFGVYVIENNKLRRVTAAEPNVETYHTVYRKYDETYVDVMNAKVTAEFVEITHAEYKKRLGDDFGKAMPGFFTDEPQYYRWATVWSDTFIEGFKKEYGYDVLGCLAGLFVEYDGSQEFRFDYYRLCNRYYTDHFIKVIYDWLHANGGQITGHSVEEAGVGGQMWTCGGIMPFYEYEDIPGMDWLGRPIGNDISPKQVSSVAAQLGKEQCLSEMFACCGWDVTPKELKKLAEWQYASGINLMCQHLMAYSIRGQRKKDYPASYSEHLAWFKEYKTFNDYFTKLGYALTRGKEVAGVLLISPVHGGYLHYRREVGNLNIPDVDQGYHKAVETLSHNQIGYHIGDEWLMEKYASVNGNTITIGQCTYNAVVLAKTDTIDASTAKLLKEYLANGGKILLLDGVPTRINGRVADTSFLQSNVTVEELRSRSSLVAKTVAGENYAPLRVMHRKTENGDLYYLVNLSDDDTTLQITFREETDLFAYDLQTEESYAVDFNALSFRGGQSYLFLAGTAEEKSAPAVSVEEKLSTQMQFISKPENALTLEYAALSYDGETYGKKLPLELLQNNLLKSRYRGDIYLKFDFAVGEIPTDLRLVTEPDNFLSVAVNGREIELKNDAWLDRSFISAPISAYAKPGENEIVIKMNYYQDDYVYYVLYGGVSETLKNCLNYNTELNQIYLVGDFAVKTEGTFTSAPRRSMIYSGNFVLENQKTEVDVADFVTKGYPYFAGSMNVVTEFDADYTSAQLELSGRFAVAKIRLNGQDAGNMMFDYVLDISKHLKKGKNKLEIELISGNRNLMGPHHNADPESYFVGPYTFTVEGSWENDKSPNWRDDPSFVQFGITDLTIRHN
ncbi:MAG: hypothetical protein IIW27_04100 [Clostridia bacterium]|nr:hypothetical protein [Clostridia bacterium]